MVPLLWYLLLDKQMSFGHPPTRLWIGIFSVIVIGIGTFLLIIAVLVPKSSDILGLLVFTSITLILLGSLTNLFFYEKRRVR